MQLKLSKNAINKAILAFEVGWSPTSGFAYYNQRLKKPTVPDPENTSSGVTIGIGYDCGYNTAAQIRQTWQSILPLHQVNALAACAGLKKQAAVNALSTHSRIQTRALRVLSLSASEAAEARSETIRKERKKEQSHLEPRPKRRRRRLRNLLPKATPYHLRRGRRHRQVRSHVQRHFLVQLVEALPSARQRVER